MRQFGDFAGFGQHEPYLHDLGAFQAGIGVGLLLAAWALVLRRRASGVSGRRPGRRDTGDHASP